MKTHRHLLDGRNTDAVIQERYRGVNMSEMLSPFSFPWQDAKSEGLSTTLASVSRCVTHAKCLESIRSLSPGCRLDSSLPFQLPLCHKSQVSYFNLQNILISWTVQQTAGCQPLYRGCLMLWQILLLSLYWWKILFISVVRHLPMADFFKWIQGSKKFVLTQGFQDSTGPFPPRQTSVACRRSS